MRASRQKHPICCQQTLVDVPDAIAQGKAADHPSPGFDLSHVHKYACSRAAYHDHSGKVSKGVQQGKKKLYAAVALQQKLHNHEHMVLTWSAWCW